MAAEYAALETGLTYAGPDQGIDFTGKGAFHAPVDLEITRIAAPDRPDHTSWPGGRIIVAKILNPKWHHWEDPDAVGYGFWLYGAEAIHPVDHLQVGSIVRKGHMLASLDSAYPGSEWGWAKDPHGTAFGTTQDGKPGGPQPIHGLHFRDWIRHLSIHW